MTEIEQHLRELEEKLLNRDFGADEEAIASLLADDFTEFGASGRIYNKAKTIAALKESTGQRTTSDFRVELLADTVALVTYRLTTVESVSLRSSLWVQREGRWQIVFHQGTRSD